MASARAMATRWAWPPDSSRGLRCGQLGDAEALQPVAGHRLGRLPALAARATAERDVVERSEVGEEQLALEDQAHPPLADRRGEQVGVAQERRALDVDEPRDRVEQAALAGAVRADDGQHLPGLGGERGPHPVGDPEVGHELGGHGVPSQWSRSATSTPIETTSITRLSESAASWSACRVT